MADVTIKQVAEIAQQATEQTTGPGKANETDVSRFQEAMQQDGVQEAGSVEEVQQAGNVESVQQAQAANGAEAANNVQAAQATQSAQEAQPAQGNKILDNLDKMSSDFKGLKENIQTSADKQGEMGDIIRLQMQVAEVTTTQTLVGKTGEKSGQGVNQLVRGQ